MPTDHRAVMLPGTAGTDCLASPLLFAKQQLWEGIDSDACLYQELLECLNLFSAITECRCHLQRTGIEMGMVVHACNLSTW